MLTRLTRIGILQVPDVLTYAFGIALGTVLAAWLLKVFHLEK